MKKHLLPLVLLLPVIAQAQTASNDLAERQLRGKVKSVMEVSYEVVEKFGEEEKGKKKTSDYREYNAAGFETLQQTEDFAKGEKTVKTSRYRDKKVLTEIREEKGTHIKLTKVAYDPKGNMETVDFTNGKGELENRQKYSYDNEGLLVQTVLYNGDGSFRSRTVFEYDANKQLVKKEWFDEGENSTYLVTYAYDDKGNQVEEKSLDTKIKTADTFIRKYSYNALNQKIEESFTRSNPRRQKSFSDEFNQSLEYNAQGDLVRSAYFPSQESFVYTYDKQGNWIRKFRRAGSDLPGFASKEEKEIVERVIRYY